MIKLLDCRRFVFYCRGKIKYIAFLAVLGLALGAAYGFSRFNPPGQPYQTVRQTFKVSLWGSATEAAELMGRTLEHSGHPEEQRLLLESVILLSDPVAGKLARDLAAVAEAEALRRLVRNLAALPEPQPQSGETSPPPQTEPGPALLSRPAVLKLVQNLNSVENPRVLQEFVQNLAVLSGLEELAPTPLSLLSAMMERDSFYHDVAVNVFGVADPADPSVPPLLFRPGGFKSPPSIRNALSFKDIDADTFYIQAYSLDKDLSLQLVQEFLTKAASVLAGHFPGSEITPLERRFTTEDTKGSVRDRNAFIASRALLGAVAAVSLVGAALLLWYMFSGKIQSADDLREYLNLSEALVSTGRQGGAYIQEALTAALGDGGRIMGVVSTISGQTALDQAKDLAEAFNKAGRPAAVLDLVSFPAETGAEALSRLAALKKDHSPILAALGVVTAHESYYQLSRQLNGMIMVERLGTSDILELERNLEIFKQNGTPILRIILN